MYRLGHLLPILSLIFGLTSCNYSVSQPKNTQISNSPQILIPTLEPGSPCPITSIQTNFWEASAPAAGKFPVWMTSYGQESSSKLGPRVLPPKSNETLFDNGITTKALIFVDQGVKGDLRITGRQLNGKGVIFFPQNSDLERVNDTTLRLLKVPPDFMLIRTANETDRSPNPPGKATHGIAPIFPNPGCYQFTFEISDNTVQVVLEVLNN
jgi:hypothetical protein